MDLSEIFNSPTFRDKMFEILGEWERRKEKPVEISDNVNIPLSEKEASLIIFGRVVSKTTMFEHRTNGLKYISGRPVMYLKEEAIKYRDKLNTERKKA